MASIEEMQHQIEYWPDSKLQMELQQPSGDVPVYLVAAEVNRRAHLRQNQQQQPQTTVLQDVQQGQPVGMAGGGFLGKIGSALTGLINPQSATTPGINGDAPVIDPTQLPQQPNRWQNFFEYLGNVGAGWAQPNGTLASGLGFANQQSAANQDALFKQAVAAKQLQMAQQQMKMQQEQQQAEIANTKAGLLAQGAQVANNGNVRGVTPMPEFNPATPGQVTFNPTEDNIPVDPNRSVEIGGQTFEIPDIAGQQLQEKLIEQQMKNNAALQKASFGAIPATAEMAKSIPGLQAGTPLPGNTWTALYKTMHPDAKVMPVTDQNGNYSVVTVSPDGQQVAVHSVGQVGPNKMAEIDAQGKNALSVAQIRAAAQAEAAQNRSAGTMDKTLISLRGQQIKPLQKDYDSYSGVLDKFSHLGVMLDNDVAGAMGQASAIPKYLSAIVGGNGSGLRINNTEIANILHARGVTGDIQAYFQKLKSGNPMTPQQVAQLKAIVSDISSAVQAKRDIIANQMDKMNQAQSTQDVYNAAKEYRSLVSAATDRDLAKSLGMQAPQGNALSPSAPNLSQTPGTQAPQANDPSQPTKVKLPSGKIVEVPPGKVLVKKTFIVNKKPKVVTGTVWADSYNQNPSAYERIQ